MKTAGFLLALALFAPEALFGQDAQVNGQWIGTYGNSTLQSGGDLTLRLVQNAQDLAGTMSFKNANSGRVVNDVPVKGTLTGTRVSLKVGQTGWFEGTVSGDSMTGKTGNANFAPNDFTLTRK